MKTLLSKISLVALVLLGSLAFASDGSLLAFATKDGVNVASASELSLSNTEMEQVKGGAWQRTYYTNISNGIVQTVNGITESYQGGGLWVIAEKYGSTLNNGYDIYLAERGNGYEPAKVNSMYGKSYSVNTVVTNPVTYGILSPYIEQAKLTLQNLKPKYN